MSSVFSPVSFLVVTYNQEKYIRAAFESALRQEGFPIEIVVTDDHSTDRTFEIVQKMAKEYRGPHKIILNQNPKNLGIVPQVNRAVSLSSGELIVGMAGDDISLPDRAARTYEEWIHSDKTAHSIFTNAKVIDEQGNLAAQRYFERFVRHGKNDFELYYPKQQMMNFRPLASGLAAYENWVLGATHAFSRASFDIFGPLGEALVVEDRAIPFRSLLLGEVRFVDEDLVLYRRHRGNFWPDNPSREQLRKIAEREYWNRESTHRQAIQDLERAAAQGLLEASEAQKHIRLSRSAIYRNAFQEGFREKKLSKNIRLCRMPKRRKRKISSSPRERRGR